MSGENWDQLDEAAYARMLIKEQYFGDLDFFRTSNEIPGCDKVIGPDFPGYGTSRRGIAILVIAGNCHAWPPFRAFRSAPSISILIKSIRGNFKPGSISMQRDA